MTGFRGLAWCAVAAVVATATTQPSFAQRQTRERQVYVSVVDKDGAPVLDLTADDFVVREDGLAREVLRIAPAPPPSHIGLLVDDSEAARNVVSELRESLWSFVATTIDFEPPPQTGLMTFGDRPTRVAPHSSSTEFLEPGIDRLFARPGSGAYMLDAIIDECADLSRAGASRPIIVAFVVEAGSEFSQAVRPRVEAALKSTGASLWTIALQGRAAPGFDLSPEARERAAVLTDVAAASGGVHRAVLSSQGLKTAMERLATTIGARYEVTYGRPDALIPPEQLEVSVTRPDVRVWAPSWPRQ